MSAPLATTVKNLDPTTAMTTTAATILPTIETETEAENKDRRIPPRIAIFHIIAGRVTAQGTVTGASTGLAEIRKIKSATNNSIAIIVLVSISILIDN